MPVLRELDDAVCELIFDKIRPTFSQVVRYQSLTIQLENAGRELKPCQKYVMDTMQANKLPVHIPQHLADLLNAKYGDNMPREVTRITGEAKEIILHGTVLHIKEDGACVVCLKMDPDVRMFRCGDCCSIWARYCGRKCQRKDWANHKHFCADMNLLQFD